MYNKVNFESLILTNGSDEVEYTPLTSSQNCPLFCFVFYGLGFYSRGLFDPQKRN